MTTKVPSTMTGFPGQLAPVGTVLPYMGSSPPADPVTAASMTFTFGDTEFDDVNNGTLTLVSSDGTSRVYTIKNDYGASTNIEFNAGASASACAANLKGAIEHADGHNGKLTVVQADGQLTITQAVSGDAGNTPVTDAASFDNACDVNTPDVFTGGRTNGWLFCDGAAVSRTTYATLFAQIGTVHGAGDESTTFLLPDLRGRFLVGRDSMGPLGDAGNVTDASHGMDAKTLGAKGATVIENNDVDTQCMSVNFIIRANEYDV